MQPDGPPGAALRTPRAAGAAGILSALLLAAAILLFRSALPTDAADATAWLGDSSHRDSLQAALNMLPFAGIFFLWFMGATRDYIGPAEDRFFATLFLGGGFLFVAVLFVTAATAFGTLTAVYNPHSAVQPELWEHDRRAVLSLLSSYATRMAAVFTMSTTTIGHHLGIFPRWLVWLGYLVALGLFFVVKSAAWFVLAFPLWILALSCYILAVNLRPRRAETHTS
ncbi:hypothetical protein ACIRYZ_33915 [Kitasatospora sp. NPDC101155]|uniref:hypothetical protein n=1 Tax=Kitasatospora sp. NPDC101155 TaxID=3364097 RepID=UPI0037F8CA5C